MKKIIITLVCFILLLSIIPTTAFASEYESLIDNADLVSSDDEYYLHTRIDFVKENHDYNITLVSENFKSNEEFLQYCESFSDYDNSANGTILIFGEFGDSYNFYSLPYGKYSDILHDEIFDKFEEFDKNAESYTDSYEMYITYVQIFLEQQDRKENPIRPLKEFVGIGSTIDGFDPMVDAAELFSETEEEQLFARIKEIQDVYDFDVTIMTMKEIPDGSFDLREYFDWYEGLDPNRDGLVVGVNMDESNREFSISARNFGMQAFTDDAHEIIHKQVPPILTNMEYVKAFNLFLDYTEEFLQTAKAGEPYKTPIALSNIVVIVVLVPLLLAAIIAWLIVKYVFVAQMKTAVIKTQAKDFMTKDSLVLTENSDIYTHTSETRTYDPIESKDDNDSGGSRTESDGYGGGRSGSSSSF